MSTSGGKPYFPEFITDVTATIDEAGFRDKKRLTEVLQSFYTEKRGSCYKVRGSYEEVEDLSHRLLALNHHQLSPDTHGRTRHQHSVRSVDVSCVIMKYILKKCPKEIEKIQNDGFIIEMHPDLSTAYKTNVKVQLTFRPQHASTQPVRVDFVRQRFISFYQRMASDLQVTTLRVSPQDHKDLRRKFPYLYFTPRQDENELSVTGPFMHIAKLEEYLLHNRQSPSKSPMNRGSASSRTMSPAPTRSKDPEDETCPICMEPIVRAEKTTLRCKHSFCKDCLKRAFDYKPVCPTCGQLYGTLTGTQPDGGEMTVTKHNSSLPGYKEYGTIIVNYYIPSGTQKEEHPNPGQPYEGVSRTAYLPDSPEGRNVVKLLRRAFDQKLIFTVGRSTTSGRNNAITWNDIHHKTSTHGGPTHYGYPDPDYLSRVQDELKVKGIE